jgi:membrane protease YdiL (CAAX protease family)
MRDESANVNGGLQIPWSGAEVVLSLFLAWLFWPIAFYAALKGLDVEHWYYGENAPEIQKRLGLWVTTLASPFQVLTYPLVFSAYSSTRLEQLGLTMRRFGRDFLAGIVGLLFLAPVVYGTWQLVRLLYRNAGEQGIEQHALEKLAQLQLFPSEWSMLFFTALITAPLHEELTFRGVLQPWLATRRWGGHAAMIGAFTLAMLIRGERLLAAWSEGFVAVMDAATPALFVLALLPLYFLVWATSHTPSGTAIFGTSVLFGCIHTSVWPTPIPLFVLSLGLGVLAFRTHSLVGPIVLHSLFNSISCVQLVLQQNN